MKNIVVFASGSGTNFQSIIDAVDRGEITASIAGLITDKDNIGALQRAETHNIPTCIISPYKLSGEAEFAEELLTQLRGWNADLIILAGYLKKIPNSVIREFENKILNIHPSLLPKFGGKGFYGMNVHRAVIEANEGESGCSVHIVTDEFDEGPVIARSKVKIEKNDTPELLAEKILKEEHQLYPKAIQKHLKTL
ncbi:MAG TPA: phosphoribosylglycinamide formyltransferase [Gracilimonas sp.]|uniref:phosphoribosylglycinamide formyltransferase n=1 Tax=Gracilimonas sp. TaxID=1974203 RepID=UPI002D940AFF|nr:phosphoribosylglycinamide formyltransferase [Gracilimonas sp.]